MRRARAPQVIRLLSRGTKAGRAAAARDDFEQGRVVVHKPVPSVWPDRYGVSWAFSDARRVR
jgi:hypothetical protein